ncbi:MAG TPA: helix-hairpin-helix domain-containing protein [Lentimicrobium sp.]|nr:helix-hairpin-helix domain-containing protein [Lentimicrobium sp.]
MRLTRPEILIFVILLFSGRILSQELPVNDTLSESTTEYLIEDVVTQTDGSFDFSDIRNQGLFGSRGGININKASERQLKRLMLNDTQIDNLKKYISSYGELTSIYELNLVEGFDSTLIIKINPFIRFDLEEELNVITASNLIKKGKNTIIARYGRDLSLPEGYHADSAGQTPYAGNADRIMLKYAYNYYDRIRFGVSMEKDAGESMAKGFDFYSWHFFYKSKKVIRAFALGSYNLRFGQGLTMNTGFNPGSNISYPVYKPLGNNISANTGTNEGMGLNGAAATFCPVKWFSITPFYSSTKQDARIYEEDTTTALYFTSLNETGLHRTADEINRKNKLDVRVYGGNLRFSHGMVSIGSTFFRTEFSEDLQTSNKPYEAFDFEGGTLFNYGSDFLIRLNSLHLFGEYSSGNEGTGAYITGLNLLPSPDYSISISWHDYSPGYYNFYSNPFSETSGSTNQKGLYAAFTSNIGKHLKIAAYASQCTFPWLKYRVDAPSKGSSYAIQAMYNWYAKNELLLRFTYRNRMQNASSVSEIVNNNSAIDYPIDISKFTFRFNLQYCPYHTLILRNRIEYLVNESPVKGTSNGYLLYQDFIYTPVNENYSVNIRYALFDTDSYDERIYAYEKDVLYSWSVPAYYYRGSKLSIMLHYKISRDLGLWLKYSTSYYPGKTSIGTGHEASNGNTTSDIKLQVLVKI